VLDRPPSNQRKLLFFKDFLIAVCGKIHAFPGSLCGFSPRRTDPNIIKQRERGQ
jgi:hypothetical protein